MCGRFNLRTPLKTIADAFDLEPTLLPPEADWPVRYNVAPTQNVAAVRQRPEGRELGWLRWGLVPAWADDPAIGNNLINARSETLAQKPAYREAFKQRRCLVLADGFYEWKQTSKPKQPYHIRRIDGATFALAGLWERWRHGDLVIESCTIVTTEANELLQPLHHRMPVILEPADCVRWLDTNQSGEHLHDLFEPFPAALLMVEPISNAVNSAKNDAPDCLAPAPAVKRQGTLFD